MAGRYERFTLWLDALKSYATLPQRPTPQEVDEALEKGVVWLRWTQFSPRDQEFPHTFSLPLEFPHTFSHALEALELLVLLACVDYEEWVRAITSIWPRATKMWISIFGRRKVALGVAVHVDGVGNLIRWTERAFEPTEREADYLKERNDMETTLDGLEVSTEIRVRFVLDDQDSSENIYRDLLAEVLNVARTQTTRAVDTAYSHGAPKLLFRLLDVCGQPFETNLDSALLKLVDNIVAYGVHVPKLDLIRMALEVSPQPPDEVMRLQRMLAAPEAHGYAPSDSVEVDALSTVRTLDGIFSAFCYSNSIRSVVVGIPVNIDETNAVRGCERLMLWLALCLFGHEKIPALETMSMCVDKFQVSDVQALERVLREGNAFDNLFPEALHLGDHKYTTVTASKFLLTHPRDSTAARSTNFKKPVYKLRLIAVEANT